MINTKQNRKKIYWRKAMSMKNSFQFLKKAAILLGILVVFTGLVFAEPAKTVTLDADDADLAFILSILAEQSGFNIVISSEIYSENTGASQMYRNFATSQQGKEMRATGKTISIHIKDVLVEEAMNLVVRAAGLSYEKIGNSYIVAPEEDLRAQVGLTAETFELKYANANEVMYMLAGFIGSTEKEDSESGDDEKRGPDIAQQKTIFGKGGSFISIDPDHNTLLIVASPKSHSEIRNVIAKIDRPSTQIVLETKIIEVSVTDAEKYGIDWSKLNHFTTILAEDAVDQYGNGVAYQGGNYVPFEQLPETQPFQKMDDWGNVGRFSRQLTAFDLTLDFLLNNNAATVLSNTRLTTVNNRTADLHIGEVIPYIVAGSGVGAEATVKEAAAGVNLKITPTINEDGYVTTLIEPNVSSVLELINGNIPRTKERRASTTVMVKDGKRIVIAGLLNTDDIVVTHKLPFFSSIPFIGKWFTHSEKTMRKTDLVIEVTPHIIPFGEEYSDDLNYSETLEQRLLENPDEDEAQMQDETETQEGGNE